MSENTTSLIVEKQSLTALLNAQQQTYRYLLVDPLKVLFQEHFLHLQELRATRGDEAICPVLRRDLAWSPAHCPQLVMLASPGESCDPAWLTKTEEMARSEVAEEKRYLCAWLCSTLPPTELAMALEEQWQELAGEFIPWFEPLRFELLHAMGPKRCLSGAIWPVSQWCYLSSAGGISHVSGNTSNEKWRLNYGILQTQHHLQPIWKLLYAWRLVCSALPTDAALQAAEAWQQAQERGLTHSEDVSYLALCSLTMPKTWLQSSVINELIEQTLVQPHPSLIQRINSLSPDLWQTLNHPAATQPRREE